MRSFASRLFLYSAVGAIVAAASPALLLRNVRVVDTRKESISSATNVLIDGFRIRAVGIAPVPSGVRIIDGRGKFLIPGLWDMHVHVGEIEEDWFPLYLANGITGLREMSASPENSVRQKNYQQAVQTGARVGPRLVWTLRAIDHDQARNAAEARQAVQKTKAAGASFIKVYNGLSREAYFAIASEAFRQSVPFTGHVPDTVRWPEAVRAGQRSIEHLDGMLLSCALRESEARRMLLGRQDATALILSSFDPQRLNALAKAAAAASCWHTPTLKVLQFFSAPSGALNDARLQYVRSDYRQEWEREARKETASGLFAKQKEAVRALFRSGAPILAGTDTPNPFCIPGFALHDELKLLVEAGLSPAAALRAATWEPARYFGREHELGSIEPGKLADLVLINADPFADISNTAKIEGVMVNGHWLNRAQLDGMLQNVRASVQRNNPVKLQK